MVFPLTLLLGKEVTVLLNPMLKGLLGSRPPWLTCPYPLTNASSSFRCVNVTGRALCVHRRHPS